MVSVHIGPYGEEPGGVAEVAYALPYGKASILFVTLAGVGVSLLAGDRSPVRLRHATWRLLVRVAVLFPLGLALQALPTNVAVILQYYAVYFLVAVAALRLPDRWLLGAALAVAAFGPIVLLSATLAQPDWFAGGGGASITEPARLARALVLTGYYPVITWVAPLLFGMWLGRRDAGAPAAARQLLAVGAAVATVAFGVSALLSGWLDAPAEPVGWAYLVVAEGHSQMPLWLVGATAVASAVLGATLLLAEAAPRLSWPLAATGQLALTIYVGHLFVLAAAPELLVRDRAGPAAASVVRFALVVVVIATLWRARFARGPIEAVLNRPRGSRADRAFH
jgi:uncharacterized membrane protein YeiB